MLLEHCVGMEFSEELEKKKTLLDKDHSKIREFALRLGMVAAVSENGVSRGTPRAWFMDHLELFGQVSLNHMPLEVRLSTAEIV